MTQITVECECPSCGGTGLYSGFAEPKGTAVICTRCKGTGMSTYSYTPFSGRKRKPGVHVIQYSQGSFIATGVGPTGASMTYDEFERRIESPAFGRDRLSK
jgi:hypothetical protein